MSATTLKQVSNVIKALCEFDAPDGMINETYGLYDGYLYNGLQNRLDAFFAKIGYHDMRVVVAGVFTQVNKYPLLTYGDESPEEINRMIVSVK